MVVRNWDLVGGNPAPGDPAAYDQLAKALAQVADNAESVHGRLKSLNGGCDTSIWRGKAADAFREEIGKLPDHLKKLLDSYRAAAAAMTNYGCTLQTLQTEADQLVEGAETAVADEQAQQQAADAARAADPAAPTATYDDAIAAARHRLQLSAEKIDQIRERRRAAETKAIDGLGHASDIGIQNESGWKKILKKVAGAAEWIAFALAVAAIVIVVAVALGVPGLNFLTLGLAGTLFKLATAASWVAFGSKLALKAGGEEISGWSLVRDGILLAIGMGGGAWAATKNVSATAFRASFTRASTTVQRVGTAYRLTQLSSSRFLLRTASISHGSLRIFHVSISARFAQPLPIATLWNTGSGLLGDIPAFLWDHGVGDAVTKTLTTPLPIVIGGSRGCTAVHARIAA